MKEHGVTNMKFSQILFLDYATARLFSLETFHVVYSHTEFWLFLLLLSSSLAMYLAEAHHVLVELLVMKNVMF